MSDRKLRTWAVEFQVTISTREESEGKDTERAFERAMAETPTTITLEVRAYTWNAARDRVHRALQGMLDRER